MIKLRAAISPVLWQRPRRKQAHNEAGLFYVRVRLPHSPAAPVTVVMVVPAMPMMMAMVAVVPPVHFRCRQPGVLLNRRGGAGIAERQRIRALCRGREREQCANGRKPQNFRYLHMWSPWVAGIAPAPTGSIE
jgi:hypothetical protein